MSTVVVTVVGALGALAIGWLGVSAVSGAGIVVFRTGSMAPTYPQGAAAISVPASAAEVVPGDVVTVVRDPDALPVTHRVLSVAAPEPGSPERELVLQGDANPDPDPRPYLVTEVRRVVVGLPEAGRVIAVARSPQGLGGLTALSAVLVAWAFWPAAEPEPDRPRSRRAAHVAGTHRPRRVVLDG